MAETEETATSDVHLGEGNMSSDSGNDYTEMATHGLYTMLNNDFDAAEDFFKSHKDESPLMLAGYSWVTFMKALMSFEDERLAEALKLLQETQKRCEHSFGGSPKSSRWGRKNKQQKETEANLQDRIEREIIIADSLLYQSILTMINQDLPSYVKGGWLMRKAWKIYGRNHRLIQLMQGKQPIIRKVAESDVDGIDGTIITEVPLADDSVCKDDIQLPEVLLTRLLGGVNFGYGCFELFLSMIPQKILRIVEFLGFEADRQTGLDSLDNCVHSKDMRSPMAVLALLWYHTILRPFFSLDGLDQAAGTDEAEVLIAAHEKKFEKSSIFMFYKARVQRVKKDLDTALSTYNYAVQLAGDQRELQLMSLYEIGWTYLMQSKWKDALYAFTRLRDDSRWSKCLYEYLVGLCLGTLGDLKAAHESFRTALTLVKRKNNQIEIFVINKCQKLKKLPPTQEHINLLGVEIIYLWHHFPALPEAELKKFLEVCENQTEKHVISLKCLLEGALYRQLKQQELALQCLEESIARHEGLKDDQHIPAFAGFEMACTYLQSPETLPKAKALLNQMKHSSKEHDFENRLSFQVKNTLKELEMRGESAV